MGTVPTMRTWTTGEVVTAAEMNSQIRDSVNFLMTAPRAVVTISTDTSVPDSSTPMKLYWTTALINSDSMYQPSASSWLQAHTAGRYEFGMYVHFPSFTTNISTIHCGVQLNNGTSWGTGKVQEDVRQTTGPNNGGIFGTSTSVRADQYMNVNDYMTFWVAQAGSGTTFTIPGGTPFNVQAYARWMASS